jgi:hypothetical protein
MTTSIKYFEIIRDVILKKVQSSIKFSGKSEEEIYKEIAAALEHNSEEWRSGRAPEIPYDEPSSRLAYLYSIVPANANLIENVFLSNIGIQEYIEDLLLYTQNIKICAFGGGPGTEALGFAKYLEKHFHPYWNQSVYVRFLLLDRVNEWLESWYEIENSIRVCSGNKTLLSSSCWQVDITDTSGFASIGDIFEQNIYILSYILSEIFDENELEALTDFIKIMADNAPDDSVFIFIDRNERRLKDRVVEIAKAIGIDLGPITNTVSNMSSDEQKSVMQGIETRLKRSPRVRWDAFYAIGTKEIPF